METCPTALLQPPLKEIIHQLSPGEEVVITENQQPVATLVSQQPKPAKPPRAGLGLCKGAIVYMAPDFDAPLEDMREYMECFLCRYIEIRLTGIPRKESIESDDTIGVANGIVRTRTRRYSSSKNREEKRS